MTYLESKKTLVGLVGGLWVLALGVAGFSMDVSTIVAKANHAAYYQGQDGKAIVQMDIVDAQDRKRSRRFVILRRNETTTDDKQQFYVYFQRPADVAKTAFLVWKNPAQDDDRWLYLPALDLVKRIAASDERTSFVGSHFFYEDVSGRNPSEDTHVLVSEDASTYIIKSTPKNPASVEFSYYQNWISKSTFLPIKTVFYDASGTAYRTYEALKIETVGGFPTVTESRLSDTKIGGSTTMTYLSVEYNVGLTSEIFSERYLRSAPRQYLR